MRNLFLLGLLVLCGCQNQPPQQFQFQTQPQIQPQPQFQPQIQPPPPPKKVEGTFKGTWVTTNVPLNGTMNCDVTDDGDGKWKGRFYGIWRGRSFDYVVNWTGEPNNLNGTAIIDGASYKWTGKISDTDFRGTYTGNRYSGSFDLRK